ncbi:Hypothetical predicted protein [Mytilus galloprovincialis]|uniref:Integrase zinc-binding domain-containing protein n=1 Tax=Mytilus galloprovincialis TaxID=29158 RepID=A0A8B6GTW7_MYTGA|nr:Hypothetical predicted protein [Mytilus galloprovincialis]
MVKQLAIPRTLRKEVLEAFHDNIVGCHQGEERTYEALRRDSDNKISKKLVNASRLKVFNSKTDRPDYLLDDNDDPFEEDEDDEGENQQVQNEGPENQTQDTISNSQPKKCTQGIIKTKIVNQNFQSKVKAVPPHNL